MENEYLFRRTPKEVKLIHTKNREICTKIPVPESMEIIDEPSALCSMGPCHRFSCKR